KQPAGQRNALQHRRTPNGLRGQSAGADRALRQVGAEKLRSIEIEHGSVIQSCAEAQLGAGGIMVEHELLPEIVGYCSERERFAQGVNGIRELSAAGEINGCAIAVEGQRSPRA